MYSTDTESMDIPSYTRILYKISLHSSSSSSQEPSIDRKQLKDSSNMKMLIKGSYDPGSGEICAKVMALSRSSVLNHEYYTYPSIKDPGILNALLEPEDKKVYEDDGQELYLDLCKEMKEIPVGLFYRGLLKKVIDLKYYGISPMGVRAMCMALVNNKTVQRLDLTSNFLEDLDPCYHLGQLLGAKNALHELILAGCRIGYKGMFRLVVHLHTRKMNLLDLSGNNIRDLGFSYLAEKLERSAVIRKLNLSRNDLSSDSASLLAESIVFNDTITHLDLSLNNFFTAKGVTALCRRLGLSKVLVELNLAWTNISPTVELRNLLRIRTLQVLDVSHNKLGFLAAKTIAQSLHTSKCLRILDLSSNPFNPKDALLILQSMTDKRIRLEELHMDNVTVERDFANELKVLKDLDYRKKTKITHGDVIHNYTISLSDIKIITLKRFVVSSMKKHWNKLDILVHLLDLNKKQDHLEASVLIHDMSLYDVPVDEEIIQALTQIFPGPIVNNKRSINLDALCDYIHQLWPEKKPPPTPPPTPPRKPKRAKNKGKSRIVKPKKEGKASAKKEKS